jgi:hypothetical protein
VNRFSSSELVAPAAELLGAVYDEAEGLYPRTIRLDVDGYRTSFSRRCELFRYSITCLLGLRAAAQEGLLKVDFDLRERVQDFARRHGPAVKRPSDVGLLLVLIGSEPGCRRLAVAKIRQLSGTIRGRARGLSVQDLSWMLWGSSVAASADLPGAALLAETTYVRLLERNVIGTTGLPEHRPVRWRHSIVSFGGVAYYLRALYEYFVLTGCTHTRELFARALQTTVRTQGLDGSWPWLLSARTGFVLERYPIYSVHQLGMAPLFLLPAIYEHVLSDVAVLARSKLWLTDNVVGMTMVQFSPTFIHRAIDRTDRWPRAQRYARASANAVRRGDAPTSLPGKLVVNAVSHSYEWGWLLFAEAGAKPLARRT